MGQDPWGGAGVEGLKGPRAKERDQHQQAESAGAQKPESRGTGCREGRSTRGVKSGHREAESQGPCGWLTGVAKGQGARSPPGVAALPRQRAAAGGSPQRQLAGR